MASNLRPDGPRAEIMSSCPEGRKLNYATYWFRLKDTKTFICTNCHATHIASSPLHESFEKLYHDPGMGENEEQSCMFHVHRIKHVLWPEALQLQSTEKLRDYFKHRLSIPDCLGLDGAPKSANVRWFAPVKGEIQSMVVCEACYEDHVLASPVISPHFGPYERPQSEFGSNWICDFSLSFIRDGSQKVKTWDEFVQGATVRMQLPLKCEGSSMLMSDTHFFTTKHPIPGLTICHACYLDEVAPTEYASEFKEAEGLKWGRTVPCAMSYFPIFVAWVVAVDRKDFSLFLDASSAVNQCPPCSKEGIESHTFYNFADSPVSNFDICPACMNGILHTFGASKFFSAVPNPSMQPKLCDLHPASPRFLEYMKKLEEALDMGVFNIFSDYVHQVHSTPNCPTWKPVSDDRLWYGFEHVNICPECYGKHIKGTAMADQMQVNGVADGDSKACDMYSPRMQSLWREACSKQDLAELLAFARVRKQVWHQTVPQMLQILQQAQMQSILANNYSASMLASTIMDGALSWGGGDGYLHGSDSLGWYNTSFGADAAIASRNASAAANNVAPLQNQMRMMELETRWNEVA